MKRSTIHFALWLWLPTAMVAGSSLGDGTGRGAVASVQEEDVRITITTREIPVRSLVELLSTQLGVPVTCHCDPEQGVAIFWRDPPPVAVRQEVMAAS